MRIGEAIRVASTAAILLLPARFSFAQEESIGNAARAARAERSQSQHAGKQVTNDDIGPNRGPVRETDDPVTVVRDALRGFLVDSGHTCHGELTNNSGPGSVVKSLIEAQGQDHIHMVVKEQRIPAGDQRLS